MPVVVKSNSGSCGVNVFLCDHLDQIKLSLTKIFNINHENFDYVALVQEYIDIIQEYRAIVFNNKLMLLYEKNKAEAQFIGNLSPLHWEGAKAIQITDQKIIAEIEKFIEPIFFKLPIPYAGLDIAIDRDQKYWLIEINSHPSYKYFILNNPQQIIVDMLKTMLKTLD